MAIAQATKARVKSAPAVSGGPGLRVVCYYRMSSDEQRGSTDQQRRECRAYAQRMGWEIVREYADEGLSGSKDVGKRVEFCRMIADSAAGEWSAVLVWDTSRFSRQDPLEAAEAKRTLRDNGIHLETVTEGRIDYATPMGRMIDFVRAEQNHDYSVKLGGNSVRGRMDVARQGYWPHGTVPYGFDRQYWTDGKPAGTYARGERPARAKGSKLKLVPNEAEAETVRWLFQNFATRDMSLRRLALEVSDRAAPLPQSGRGTWNKDVVKDILQHPAYLGDTPVGSHRRAGEQKAFNRCESILIPNTHPALIDRGTWETCGAKLQKIRTTGRRGRSHRSSPLSGIIVCGHCGYCMAKIVRPDGRSVFRCQSATSRPSLGCKQWVAHEDYLLELVRTELVKAIDLEVLRNLQARPPEQSTTELDALRARAADLAQKVERGTKNLLLADPGVFPKMRAALEELENELARVQNTIKLADSAGGAGEHEAFKAWWESAKDRLVKVIPAEWSEDDRGSVEMFVGKTTKYLKPAIRVEPDVLRDLLHRLNARVVLHWTPNGKRYFKLDYARLRAELSPENLLEGGTSTTTASSSPPPASGASCSRG